MIANGFVKRLIVPGIMGLLLIVFSCSDGESVDSSVLTEAQMVKVLTELYLSEQKINRIGLPRDSSEYHFNRLKPVIFKNAGVADSVFKRSFDYYMDRPKSMERIYTAVVDSLSLMEQRLDVSRKK